MQNMNLHQIEEQDFGRGPRLWDATPDVCCAAFQLGACSHTEAMDWDYELSTMPETTVAPAPEPDDGLPF